MNLHPTIARQIAADHAAEIRRNAEAARRVRLAAHDAPTGRVRTRPTLRFAFRARVSGC